MVGLAIDAFQEQVKNQILLSCVHGGKASCRTKESDWVSGDEIYEKDRI